MADCKETIEQLETYLDEELPGERVAAIVDHLKSCSDCQGAYEFHAELTRVISVKAQRDEVSPEFLGRLRGCLDIDLLGDNGRTGSAG